MKKTGCFLLVLFFILSCNGENKKNQNESAEPEIFQTIKAHDISSLKKLLAKKVNVEVLDQINATPLCAAAEENNIEIVQLLIQAGADVNFASNRSTPIVYAAENNNIPMIEILLAHGADINSTLRYANMSGGSSAILEAIINNNFELVEFLLAHGADINKGTFIEGEGAAILLIEDCNAGRPEEKIVMHPKNLQMLEFILKKGFDVEQACHYGNALSVAVQNEDIPAIKILLQYGANPEKYIDELGLTVRELAHKTGNAEIIKLLQN